MDMTIVSVIVGSTRQGRFSEKPAQWMFQHLQKRDGIEVRLLDLRDFPMPFFDQPVPPAKPDRAPYEHEVVKRWTAHIAASDGFVFVTPEPQGSGVRELWQRPGSAQRSAAPAGGNRGSNGSDSLVRPYSRCDSLGTFSGRRCGEGTRRAGNACQGTD
jgi:NADPH-dependent FMN reductase